MTSLKEWMDAQWQAPGVKFSGHGVVYLGTDLKTMTKANWKNIKRAIREKYEWPGGYPLFIAMRDGEALSIDAARANWRHICRAYVSGDMRDSWYPAEAMVNWENPDLYCAHTNNRIESAYADD